ncbi:hypothetical protein E2562_025153 [Oryza meyeriana var. granulata]|uniref:Uncharacterized protein n=1 Tax=Oryza meyeriana var. granulata TaxID=110450 RepID=A0A6G1E194_9ORYZ|nr:hypothetical protein E2562_025153 [Oryza meyeriana var. granulata]
MPQVDLESLVCGVAGAGAGDRKVSCETVIAGESGDASPPRMPPPPDPDFPPESITIPIGDEVAFSELNPIYDRDDSTKGSTNPKSAANGASNPIPAKSRSNSTRIAGAPAAATTFFGLPASIRPAFTRRRPSQGRILPDKRSGGRGGGGGSGSRRGDGEEEPQSPKVSCIGKVLSDRERYGRSRGRRWWRGLVAVFLCGGGCSCQGGGGGRHARKKVALDEDHDGDDDKQPGIAAMRRFKSGRRTASWVEEAIAAAEAAGEKEQQEDDDEKQHEKVEHHDTEQWAPRQVS